MKRYFILGTDTDCGKTHVTCQLIDFLKENQQRVHAIKPVASGCVAGVSEDVLALNTHLGHLSEGDEKRFWRLIRPISPHLAALEEGVALSTHLIAEACQQQPSVDLDYLLIEGAGGLMVPLNAHETWIDFFILTKIPVILVVGIRLGCINHALLTNFAMRSHGIECVGWVANCLAPNELAVPEIIQTLTEKMGNPLAIIPFYNAEQCISKFESIISK